MSKARVNGVELHYELEGDGEPVVLVHGSWTDAHSWERVAGDLARSLRVLRYDRRGHSRSERPTAQGSMREDVADAASLVEELGLAPAHFAGNSWGGMIVLRLAGERPELFRSLLVHEPPIFGLLSEDERPHDLGRVRQLLEAGDDEAAARTFVEEVAFGTGAWETFPRPLRETFVRNAPTFLDELRDPDQLTFDTDALWEFDRPALLTYGTESAPHFRKVVELLSWAMPGAETRVLEGAGHAPQGQVRELYVETLTGWISESAAA